MTIQEALQQAYEDALYTYKADRESGSDSVATAWNAGRVDGLKLALDLLTRYPLK